MVTLASNITFVLFITVFSEEEPDLNNELEISVRMKKKTWWFDECNFIALLFPPTLQTAETIETIVTQLMEKQRAARAAALNKQLECGCPDSNATNGDKTQCCIHSTTTTTAVTTVRNSSKVQATKSEAHTTTGRSRSNKQSQRMMRLMQENNNNQVRLHSSMIMKFLFSPPFLWVKIRNLFRRKPQAPWFEINI